MKNHSLLRLILILTPFVFSFAFGLDIYIPILPQMTQLFDTTPSVVQLTMSLFLLTTGVGQLFIGPLSDQYGRRKIFFLSSIFFGFGSLCCALSPTITWLIISRIISSLGACGLLVTSFALVRDLYSGKESAEMYSFLNGAIGISPTFAPILGGYLAIYFGWQSIFYFLTCLGLYSFFVTKKWVHETHPLEKRTPLNKSVLFSYASIFKNRQFLIYSFIAGFAEAVFFCFFSTSPFIIIDLLEIPTHQFGYYFAVFGAVVSLGGILSAKIIKKFGIENTIKIGISLMIIGGVSMLSLALFSPLSIENFLIPMIFACTGAIFLVGSSASAALEPFPFIAGTASAAFGALEFGISAIVGAILMTFPIHSTIPYALSILVMSFLSIVMFKYRARSPELISDEI
ncbi:MAG: multidrug effflux MFS transporter [Parachlamydiaceae bacterium]|nr:multidrug effflux MFS transporter [Parachlamydiaceae bacterium]